MLLLAMYRSTVFFCLTGPLDWVVQRSLIWQPLTIAGTGFLPARCLSVAEAVMSSIGGEVTRLNNRNCALSVKLTKLV